MNSFLEFVSPHKYGNKTPQPSMNIKMEYMYRDAGNNKLRNRAIFPNNHGLSLCQVADFVLAAFIKRKWFDPDLCGIERLIFESHDSDLDHEWHEVENVSLTNDPITIDIDIADFLFNAIKAHVGWVKFDCREKEFEFEN